MTLSLTPALIVSVPTNDLRKDAVLARFGRHCTALGLSLPMPALVPCLGRDGSLTAKRDGHWLAGCSVPRRAAERMLRHEHWAGRSLCLLTPTHGQQVAAVLAKLAPTSSLVVAFASLDAVADALFCGDFTADLAAGRLHVAWDDASLAAGFEKHPGLAVPRQIVRLPDADPTDSAAMRWTQAVLGRMTQHHSRRVAEAATHATLAAPAGRCVLVGRHFRLWDDAGDTLASIVDSFAAGRDLAGGDLNDRSTIVIDSDAPLAAADALHAERCAAAAVTIADRPRPAWATWPRPWIAWLPAAAPKANTANGTASTYAPTFVPSFNPAFADDALLLANDAAVAAARAGGWPADRVALARWPDPRASAARRAYTPGAPLALMADLPDLEPPADIAELSSRQVVWEAIHEELTKNPCALGDDAVRYVERAPARLGLPPAADFPVQRFIDALVIPAVALGVAHWLAANGVAFTLHGRGWAKHETLAAHDRGPVADRPDFEAIVAASGGVVDPFLAAAHPVRSLGVPTLKTVGRTPQRVLQDVAAIKSGRLPIASISSPLAAEVLASFINGHE